MLTKAPLFELNLNLHESIRWKHIIEHYKDQLDDIVLEINETLEKITSSVYFNWIISPIINIFKSFNCCMYADELVYFSKVFNISFEKLLILQLYYEISAACTSIGTKINNKNAMFRTMDWPLDFLKKLTLDLKVTKNNNILYYATTWLGYVGMLTITVPNSHSLAINFRSTQTTTIWTVIKNAIKSMSLKWPIGYAMRHVADEQYSYKSAMQFLKTVNLISPCYITVCHKRDLPFVIIRDPTNYIIHTDDNMCQTNCDFNKREPNILYSVERRELGYNTIKNNHNNFHSIDDIIDQLAVHPIINNDTIYLCVMIPKSGKHRSFIIDNMY